MTPSDIVNNEDIDQQGYHACTTLARAQSRDWPLLHLLACEPQRAFQESSCKDPETSAETSTLEQHEMVFSGWPQSALVLVARISNWDVRDLGERPLRNWKGELGAGSACY